MGLKPSEFIQNHDGTIYHLKLLPEQLAPTIITVGDQDRVTSVTKYFDDIECIVQKREFHTQTGSYKGKRISVVSTGIGTDNIDIVLNELDALVNIDFSTKTVKKQLTSLDIFRIGTSGAIQPEISVDSFLLSEAAVGLDALLHFYDIKKIEDAIFSEALVQHMDEDALGMIPYVVSCNKELSAIFPENFYRGITVTNSGFYAPQGRILRLPLRNPLLNKKLESFCYSGKKITNMEMETSGIYGLSKLMGHRAVSLNAIVANRATGEFSLNPHQTIDKLILSTLNIIAQKVF